MKRIFLQKTIRPVMYLAILGLTLTALTGCGVGHGGYRHSYTGYDDVRNGNGYHNNVPYSTKYGPDDRDYHRHMPGYGYDGSGYCRW